MKDFNCQYLGVCGGCSESISKIDSKPLVLKTYIENQNNQNLKQILNSFSWPNNNNINKNNININNNNIETYKLDGYGHRNRADITYENHKFGFYNINKQVFSLDFCPHWEPEVQDLFHQLKQFKFPFKKASFRIRAGKNIDSGLWIDAAHNEFKEFLSDHQLLKNLFTIFPNIEVGQKAKKLDPVSFKLIKANETQLKNYFTTYDYRSLKSIHLKSFIKSFSQPSLLYNKVILDLIFDMLKDLKGPFNILELGSGCGNFTIFLAKLIETKSLMALEYDPQSLMSLKANIFENNLQEKVQIQSFDFCSSFSKYDFKRFNLLFANPSRSGLGQFMYYVTENKPQYFFYLSCYPETLAKDLSALYEKYKVKRLAVIDQFPQSKHFETLVLLELVE